MTNDPLMFEGERFILCEGRADKDFLESLIIGRKLPPFQIRQASEFTGGETGGRSAFSTFVRGCSVLNGFQDLKGIAIVTDNDDVQILNVIEKELAKYGYSPPNQPGDIGYIDEKPTAIILIPDNLGNLETYCLPVLYDTWPNARECIEIYLRCTGAMRWEKQH